MFEIVVAYYFAFTIGGSYYQAGPFSTDSQCERQRKWTARHGTEVSECWYGPAISLARPGNK